MRVAAQGERDVLAGVLQPGARGAARSVSGRRVGREVGRDPVHLFEDGGKDGGGRGVIEVRHGRAKSTVRTVSDELTPFEAVGFFFTRTLLRMAFFMDAPP